MGVVRGRGIAGACSRQRTNGRTWFLSRPCGIRRRLDEVHELVAEITGGNGEMSTSKGPGAAARRRRERWRTRAHGLVNIPGLQDPRSVSVDAGYYTTNTCH